MTDAHTYTYDLSTFSIGGNVAGPCAQPHDAALEYLAQRMADQHRGGLTIFYWRSQASRLLAEAKDCPGVDCSRTVLRGRGVTVMAFVATSAASFGVELFPLFDDDGPLGSVVCAAAHHPRLSVAMREAGLRAEAWLRTHAAAVSTADERGPVIGFEATVDGRLLAPLPSQADAAPPSHSGHRLLRAA
jgi:hypothetical protein